jgi:hypothetical protein
VRYHWVLIPQKTVFFIVTDVKTSILTVLPSKGGQSSHSTKQQLASYEYISKATYIYTREISLQETFSRVRREVYTCCEPKGLRVERLVVFTAVAMKNGVFWDVTPCNCCKNRRFGGT